ncbi:MAG: methyltransferase domain-containing protein [Candidatus Omnitrophica bacterium]|nr:methyltransferase domain-containing protein [Candidatus Omnitrophota bacterium]
MSVESLKASYEEIYRTHGIRDHLAFYRWVVALLRPEAGRRFLDVACGEGDVLAEASRRGVAAYGIDIAEAAVARARRNAPHATIIAGDAEKLPWGSESFQYATCLGSLENMPHPDEALAEIRRVLAPTGRACFVLPNKYWLGDVLEVAWRGEEAGSFQPFERQGTCQQWRRWLARHGFQVRAVYRYNKRPSLFRGHKMKSIRKFAWRSLFNSLCPFYLSWSFVYLCEKIHAHPIQNGSAASQYWRLE